MKEAIKGKISQIIGAVVDATFDDGTALPDIYDALKVVRPDGTEVVLECQQDIGETPCVQSPWTAPTVCSAAPRWSLWEARSPCP